MTSSKIVSVCVFIALVLCSLILLWYYNKHTSDVRRPQTRLVSSVSAEEDEKRLLKRKPTIWDVEMGQSSSSVEDVQPIAASVIYFSSPPSSPNKPTPPPPSSLVTFSVLILPPSPPSSSPRDSISTARRVKWMANSDSGEDDDDYDEGDEIPEVEIGVATEEVWDDHVRDDCVSI